MYNETIYRPFGRGNKIFKVESVGISYCDDTYDISRKNSRMTIFEYVISGGGTVEVNNNVFYPTGGDVYILPKGSNQHYYSDSYDPWTKIWFTASGSLIDNLLSTYNVDNTYFFPDANQKTLFENLFFGVRDNIYTASGKNALIFHELCVNLSNIFIPTRRNVSPIALEIQEYIDAHINEDINLNDISRQVYRSASQVVRSFKKAFGITPHQYIIEERIKTAKMLLTNHNYLTVKEVAFQLNFSDEHYFSNYFKSRVGISPSAYRKSKLT